MKICNKCGETKPLEEFYKRSDSKGVRSPCKKCLGRYKDITCTVCGKIHNHYSMGRKSIVCEECYPKYRAMYNLFYSAMYRSNCKKLEFNLTLDWLLTRGDFCSKTGIKLTYSGNGKNYTTRLPTCASIDKIDPTKGYTIDNCQLVCWWYNVSKQTFTEEEVYSLAKCLVTFYETNRAPNANKMVRIGQEII